MFFSETRRVVVAWTGNFAGSWGTLGCGRECGAGVSQIPSIRVVLGLKLELKFDQVVSC